MNADEFAEGIYLVAYESAVQGVIKVLSQPPGRRPRPELVKLSVWFNGLSEGDQERLADVVRLAADHAIFGVLAVLDGVRVLDEAHTEFELRTGNGTLVNAEHDLHDAFRAAVDGRRESADPAVGG